MQKDFNYKHSNGKVNQILFFIVHPGAIFREIIDAIFKDYSASFVNLENFSKEYLSKFGQVIFG